MIVVIGANPTDAHPVFASRMKKRLRQGAKLIVVDPRRTDLVRSAHIKAQYHLPLMPGTNVAMLNALAHTIVTEGLTDAAYIQERCDLDAYAAWEDFIRRPENSPETVASYTGVPGRPDPRRRPSLRHRAMARSITGSVLPSTARARPRSWAWPIWRW